MLRRTLAPLLILLGLCSAGRAQENPPLSRFFAGAGLYQADGRSDFDRVHAGSRRRGPGVLLQAGAMLYRSENLEVVAQYVHVLDADRDGADIRMPLGELRLRFGPQDRLYFGIGGGISNGPARRESHIETLAIGADLPKRTYAELRGIFDERDAHLFALIAGVRF